MNIKQRRLSKECFSLKVSIRHYARIYCSNEQIYAVRGTKVDIFSISHTSQSIVESEMKPY